MPDDHSHRVVELFDLAQSYEPIIHGAMALERHSPPGRDFRSDSRWPPAIRRPTRGNRRFVKAQSLSRKVGRTYVCPSLETTFLLAGRAADASPSITADNAFKLELTVSGRDRKGTDNKTCL